jgi:hypothetical protein
MKTTALTTMLLAAGALAYAQTPQRPATPPPALVSDVQMQPQDSPLVQAAKRNVANRQKVTAAHIGVITNETVARSTGTLSTTTAVAPIPVYTPRKSDSAPATATRKPDVPAPASSGKDPYELLAEDNPRLPAVARNRTTPQANMAPSSPIDARAVQNTSSARPRTSASDATVPSTATNLTDDPPQSQNAGPNRPIRP